MHCNDTGLDDVLCRRVTYWPIIASFITTDTSSGCQRVADPQVPNTLLLSTPSIIIIIYLFIYLFIYYAQNSIKTYN